MKFSVITLGCKVNAFESESYIQGLLDKGYEYVDADQKADIYIVNSCAVTNEAARKTRQKINRASRLNPEALIAVVGCYVQVESESLEKNDFIDLLIGSSDKDKLADLVDKALQGSQINNVDTTTREFEFEDLSIESHQHQTRAFLKIQDGCDQFCSYCIIPYARGQERSQDLSVVLDNAQQLVDKGHKEIVLSGIHTGRYGKGINTSLYELMSKLDEFEALKRLRVSSIEVNEVTSDIIELAKRSDKIANHWHIPLQAGDDETLKRMNRHYPTAVYAEKLKEIRRELGNISISADVMVGFPGETDEEFENTYQFIKDNELSFLHVFPFSPKDGTPAALSEKQIPKDVKKQRVQRLLELSSNLEHQFMSKFIGEDVTVLFETQEDQEYQGYASEYFMVRTTSDRDLRNELVTITIKDVKDGVAYGSVAI